VRNIIVLSLALLMVVAPQASAVAPTIQEKPTETKIVSLKDKEILTRDEVLALVHEKARKYAVSPEVMMVVIDCETSGEYKPKLQSRIIINGEREESYGLVQINLPWNPDVSYAQATDPDFAVDFLARRISEGYARRWTCYRLKYN
jgi:hypothetical protein